MKKIISVMLCLAMLITPLMSMAEVTYPLSETPIKLTYWMPLNGGAAKYITSYDENTAYAQMQLDTGVDIEWKHPAVGQEGEAFNMMLLSKELPDLIAMANKYTGGEHQGVRDGIFVDLTPYLEEYAPDYWALLQSNEDFRRTVTDENGMIAAFCTYKEPGDPNAMRLVLQDSVMKDLGAEIPLTIADWDALFEKMLAKGITPYLLDANGQSKLFMGAFDTYPGFYVKDGQVQYGFMNEGFRAYLKQMNEWYQKGYISKDFTSIDGNTANTMFDSGAVGTYTTAIVACFNRNQKKAQTILSSPYPRVTADQKLHWDDADSSPRWYNNENTTAISASCKNIPAAVSFLNYAYTDKGIELLNWGVEGLNWDWVDGQRVYNDLMLNHEVYSTEEASYIYKVHFATKYTQRATFCHANLLKSPASLAIRMQYSDDPNFDDAYYLPQFNLNEDDNTRKAEIMTDVTTYVNEMILKYIVGAESLDSYDTFVATVNAMGMPEVLDIMQRGYEAYMAK